jgi:hypothetical protein
LICPIKVKFEISYEIIQIFFIDMFLQDRTLEYIESFISLRGSKGFSGGHLSLDPVKG